jgi:hypothetical protein
MKAFSIYFNQSSPGSLSPASFSPRVALHLGEDDGYLMEPAIGDIDGDGKPDIACWMLGVIVNLGKTRFGNAPVPTINSNNPAAAADRRGGPDQRKRISIPPRNSTSSISGSGGRRCFPPAPQF